MSLTRIEIDDELLETAKRLGGHKTKTAAVVKALGEYNERLNRAAALDKYFELAQSWDLERAEAAHRAARSLPCPPRLTSVGQVRTAGSAEAARVGRAVDLAAAAEPGVAGGHALLVVRAPHLDLDDDA